MEPVSILATGPSGTTTRFRSLRAASRVLSGNGSDSARRTIARRLAQGGGMVGNVRVESIRRSR